MMEIDDCAFPLLAGMTAHSDPMTAFKDADCALLVGARPRGPGMERKDLLEANAQFFTVQGKALDAVASRNVKVLVVGNPAPFGFEAPDEILQDVIRSEEHTSELQSQLTISYAVFCLKKIIVG